MRPPLLLLPFLAISCHTAKIPPASPPSLAPSPTVTASAQVKPTDTQVTKVYHGKASYYSVQTNGGTTTASGQRLRNEAYTAAHRTLPFGTRVRVTNLNNNKSAIVHINDRGPFTKGRIIDVTIGVGRHLGMIRSGLIPCKVEVLEK